MNYNIIKANSDLYLILEPISMAVSIVLSVPLLCYDTFKSYINMESNGYK